MRQLLTLKEPIDAISCASDLFDQLKDISIDFSQENTIAVYLNSSNQVLGSEIIFKGGLNSCVIDPKTIFRRALLNNACSIIVAHNHPSGNLKPSQEDLKIMEIIKKAGEIVTIRLLDFIVFNGEEYWSCMG